MKNKEKIQQIKEQNALLATLFKKNQDEERYC